MSTEQPTRDEIKEFLDVFRKLESMESHQRVMRGYGTFRREEAPVPGVVKTITWLKGMVS